jgi:GDP-D-mannose dehydratase
VLATGERHSVREFVEKAFACADRTIEWQGSGVNEKGIDARSGQVLIAVDARSVQGAKAARLATQNELRRHGEGDGCGRPGGGTSRNRAKEPP